MPTPRRPSSTRRSCPLLFLSGVFIPLGSNAPAWILWIARIFPVWHFARGMQAGFLGTPFSWTDVLVVAAWGGGRPAGGHPVLQLGAAGLSASALGDPGAWHPAAGALAFGLPGRLVTATEGGLR